MEAGSGQWEVAVAVAPLRLEPSDTSEQVSQILAGEVLQILEHGLRDWVRIELIHDGYVGWCDQKQLAKHVYDVDAVYMILQAPLSEWQREDGSCVVLPAGARLTWHQSGSWNVGGMKVVPLSDLESCSAPHVSPLSAASQFLGSPYAWGGKSALGMDCSGLVQLAFWLCGISVPRDAIAQAECGIPIDFTNRMIGDAVFFKNNVERVVHVGILCSEDEIMHACGDVRIDTMQSDGIYRSKKKTHDFHSVRRIA